MTDNEFEKLKEEQARLTELIEQEKERRDTVKKLEGIISRLEETVKIKITTSLIDATLVAVYQDVTEEDTVEFKELQELLIGYYRDKLKKVMNQ